MFSFAHVGKWLEHQPAHCRVTGSISGLGHVPELQVQFLALHRVSVGGNKPICLSQIHVSPFSPSHSLYKKTKQNSMGKISLLLG